MQREPRLLPMMFALVLLPMLAACGSHGAVRRGAATTPAHGQPLAARQSGQTPSPPQQPSDAPLVVATQPELPPPDAPLAATTVQVPAALSDSFSAGRQVNLPAGFQASIYALTGGGPRFMALSPDGHVFV